MESSPALYTMHKRWLSKKYFSFPLPVQGIFFELNVYTKSHLAQLARSQVTNQERLGCCCNQELILENIDLGDFILIMRFKNDSRSRRKTLYNHLRRRNVIKFEFALVTSTLKTAIKQFCDSRHVGLQNETKVKKYGYKSRSIGFPS